MNDFRQKCIELRKRDYTLAEIVRATGRSKTSVYAHIRDMPLSERKRAAVRTASAIRASTIAEARRGKSLRVFEKFTVWDADTVRLVSHFIFDGEIKRSGCSYNNRNKPLLNQVEISMKKIYAFPPRRYTNRVTSVHRISYHNVALAAYIETKAAELLTAISSMSKSLKLVFIQSFFDDEGCMDFRPQRNLRQVRGYQKNVEILALIQKLLADLQIRATVKKPNEVVIVGKENLSRFQKVIGFSPGVRINGKRPNSIWKKSLEKREILQKALDSYIT